MRKLLLHLVRRTDAHHEEKLRIALAERALVVCCVRANARHVTSELHVNHFTSVTTFGLSNPVCHFSRTVSKPKATLPVNSVDHQKANQGLFEFFEKY